MSSSHAADIETLDVVLRRLDDLATPGSRRCGVADEHKEAVRLFVTSWVTPAVKAVRDHLNGDDTAASLKIWRNDL